MRKDDALYESQFGNIPDNQLDRITYILGNKAKNVSYNQMIQAEAKKIKRIKFKKVNFTLWKIVKPSARPRANTTAGFVRMYVPHAKENGDWFERWFQEQDLPRIETPCIVNMDIYEKTPSSFSKKNKVLAELGLIRPWKRTGDVDNYAKGILDCIQHGMLQDDCLTVESTQRLWYSIKPHADIEIRYMEKFPEY